MVLLASALAVLASYVGVRIIRDWARHHRVIDLPSERTMHAKPTPRGGGLAIVLTLLAGSWLLYPRRGGDVPFDLMLGFTLGAIAIAAISLLDDLRATPRLVRFLVQSAAAIAVIVAIEPWEWAPVMRPGHSVWSWIVPAVAFLWLTGLTNAYNFMDGIDGLAAAQAVLAGMAWALIGWISGLPMITSIGALIAAASAGFLVHNWPPASIFMGDVGSAFLGFSLAVLPLMAGRVHHRLALIGPLLVWPFLFDTAFTLLRRLIRGENIFEGHRSHLYQRLAVSGLSHGQVTVLYSGFGSVAIGLAIGLAAGWPTTQALVLVVIPLSALGLWMTVVWRERNASENAR
ncbi:MAG: glycosyltransferase family 4 protein [Acidobacteria bacterium]|nr:glycosyltransferase family 4 protein [Acidobacteriota bacterium]